MKPSVAVSRPLSIERVGPESTALLTNLFEHYLHDMAEWFEVEVGLDGRYGYDLAPHWRDGDIAYLAHAGGVPAGFAIIGSAERWPEEACDYDMHEFFVARRYRRSGFGEQIAHHLWQEHPGRWLVRVLEANTPALGFWRAIIESFTSGRYSQRTVATAAGPRAFFRFESRADDSIAIHSRTGGKE